MFRMHKEWTKMDADSKANNSHNHLKTVCEIERWSKESLAVITDKNSEHSDTHTHTHTHMHVRAGESSINLLEKSLWRASK